MNIKVAGLCCIIWIIVFILDLVTQQSDSVFMTAMKSGLLGLAYFEIWNYARIKGP